MILDRPPYWMAPLLGVILWICIGKLAFFHVFSQYAQDNRRNQLKS